MKKSGVNPGVHLTCRRLEGEVEFCVRCCLCEGTKQWSSLSTVPQRSNKEENWPKGETMCGPEKRVCPPEEALDWRPWDVSALGTGQEHQMQASVAGIPWSGMIPLVMCGYPVDRNPSSKSVSSAHCSQSVSKARESFTREQSDRLSRPQPVSWSISKKG